jgi:hypothetical protein
MRDAMLMVTAAVAPMQAEPRAGAEQLSQRPHGHRLEPLELRSPWFRVRSADGYEGWVHSGYVKMLSAREAAARFRLGRISLGCMVRNGDGLVRRRPLGSVLADEVTVVEGEALTPDELALRFPADADAIVRTAVERFAGTPYQWGGVTPWGADCSGMVQTAFALHGISLPRDAWQQAEAGRDAGRDLRALRTADLLFFSDRDDGRITHVGICAGPMRMVHLALGRGGWALEDLSATDDAYVTALVARFRFARRVLD